MWKLVVLGLYFGFTLQANASKAIWMGTPALSFADLGGADSACAARYEIDSDRFLCMSWSDWRRALVHAAWGCPARFEGRWKEVRSLGGERSEIRTLRFFQALRWSALNCDVSPLRSFMIRVERVRWTWSRKLEKVDSFGIFRHLLLAQKTPALHAVPWRELGFVHLLTLTGIHLYALAAWVDGATGRILFRFPRWVRPAKLPPPKSIT